MKDMYNKLFTKILDSSIWMEPTPTRIVWLTLIAAMDEDGFAQFASVGNLAHRALVPREDAEKAVRTLESADPDSSDPDHEGRRIERVDGGWMVLNAKKYRDIVTREVAKAQTRARVLKFREKKRDVTEVKRMCNGDVTPSGSVSEAEAKAKTDAEAVPTPKSPRGVVEGKPSDLLPTTEQSLRIAKMFHRRPTTAWSKDEVKSYKAIGTVPEDDMALLEGYYKSSDKYLRRDLYTFLNNFTGELDRARAWQKGKVNDGKDAADDWLEMKDKFSKDLGWEHNKKK